MTECTAPVVRRINVGTLIAVSCGFSLPSGRANTTIGCSLYGEFKKSIKPSTSVSELTNHAFDEVCRPSRQAAVAKVMPRTNWEWTAGWAPRFRAANR